MMRECSGVAGKRFAVSMHTTSQPANAVGQQGPLRPADPCTFLRPHVRALSSLHVTRLGSHRHIRSSALAVQLTNCAQATPGAHSQLGKASLGAQVAGLPNNTQMLHALLPCGPDHRVPQKHANYTSSAILLPGVSTVLRALGSVCQPLRLRSHIDASLVVRITHLIHDVQHASDARLKDVCACERQGAFLSRGGWACGPSCGMGSDDESSTTAVTP